MGLHKYEAVHVLHPHLSEEDLATNIAKFEDAIKNFGGSVDKTERQGKKKLVFHVKKVNDGFFTLVDFSLPADKVESLKRYCKLSEQTIRYFITRKAG